MKLVTKNVGYALRALCYIAEQKSRVVPAVELCSHLGIPRPFLRRLLQHLNKSGLLISHKGKGGGFKPAVAAGKMSALRVIEAFHGELNLINCFVRMEVCSDVKTCPLRKQIKDIEEYVRKRLSLVTVESLCREKREGIRNSRK